ncbi:hypothetical protein FA13DRAFT_814809 [Coprinellus micaceus]|uniref:BTB domain-containing protein n=1 Tax=Coprinellus micaceus TaxID=71717 RepID=A0A4Y7T1X1_COPMI|nr:hypothetical protein FA13DRAFT_814809 [Coprinellus micaceus]
MTIQHSASTTHRSGLIVDIPTPAMAPRREIVYLKAEDETFVAGRQALVGHSLVFEDMFLVGNSSSGEGRSAENPVFLEGYKAADLEALLIILYPTTDDVIAGKFTLTKEQWVGVLRIARPWRMEKIRKLAIEALSEGAYGLTAVDKVALGLNHKVASWLIEGLTTLASAAQEFPLDSIEEAVGPRTAYRIAGVQMKANPKARVTSISVGRNRCVAFPIAAIHCVFCCKPMVTGGLGCQSCSICLRSGILGAIYVSPSAETSKVFIPSSIGSHCFYLPAGHVTCSSCHHPAIPQGITCPSCNRYHAGSTNMYLALCPPTQSQPVPSTEDLVREAFKNEIDECEP